MTRLRLVGAMAAILTVLLLQATLVAPVLAPLAVSLPAVLVAAIALTDGPSTGMSFGFAAGLVADLGTSHPAGVLALCWLGVGLVCGAAADRHRLRHDALTAGVVCGVAGSAATLLLALVNAGPVWTDALRDLVPVTVADTVLALGLLVIVRRMLRSEALRAPRPVLTDLVIGGRHG
ncbi:MAG TPA: hypothetical protein VGN18_09615 [Jatrophihabitans sp.]|jgi:cell shape-determining protein MreD|uniref:hypothetical protein n=1 Tax=Jatrophihabitans sp. TaxID=1932789 RepID=UPI002DFB11AD|nr:hypothetical protein [Jatrophihabitans sp.]